MHASLRSVLFIILGEEYKV